LATHLTSAFAIYSLIIWTGFNVLKETPYLASRSVAEVAATLRVRTLLLPMGVLIGVTAISGAYVAGMKAGHHFNTFPLMDGQIVPEGYGGELVPFYRNFFEHIPTVQFDHRLLAVSTLLSTTSLLAYSRTALPGLPPMVKTGIVAMAVMTGAQVTLGVTTLVYAVPVWLGAAHQAGALTLFTFTLWTLHAVRLPRAGSATLREARKLLSSGGLKLKGTSAAKPAPMASPQLATAPTQAPIKGPP